MTELERVIFVVVCNTMLRVDETNHFRVLRRFRGVAPDFPVPTETAAFLHPESTHSHCFVENDLGCYGGGTEGAKHELIVALFHTHRTKTSPYVDENNNEKEYDINNADLLTMSLSLDSLGWKKVFVDLRRNLPTLSFPKVLSSLLNRTANSVTTAGNVTVANSLDTVLTRGRNGFVVESKALASAFNHPVTSGPFQIYFPNAHNMICAWSRNRRGAHVYQEGRPVMDAMAEDVVKDMLVLDPETF